MSQPLSHPVHQTETASPHNPWLQTTISLFRRRQDFSDRDLAVLNHLSPHFVQAYKNCSAWQEATGQRSFLAETLSRRSHEVIFARADGRVEWLSPRARQWVQEYAGVSVVEGEMLPERLARLQQRQQQQLATRQCQAAEWAAQTLSLPDRRLRMQAHQEADGRIRILLVEERNARLSRCSNGLA